MKAGVITQRTIITQKRMESQIILFLFLLYAEGIFLFLVPI